MKINRNLKWICLSVFLMVVAVFSFVVYSRNKSSKQQGLSVVLPIYNVSKYLPKCLDSLINQTYADMEIICVNDGSKDNSLEILREYEKKDKRIVVIDKSNGGVSSARNAGILAAKREYVTFVDPDDYVDLNAYEKCMTKAKAENADIIVFDYIIEPENRQPIKLIDKKYTDPFQAISDPDINSGFVWNKVFKRSLMVENKILFKEDINYAEDNLFVNMILTKGKCVITCPSVFYHYQYHPDSSGNSVSKEKQISNAIKRCNYIIDYYVAEGYTHRYNWILDYCIAITHDAIKSFDDVEKKKNYYEQILYVLDNKLLNRMEDVPEHLDLLVKEMRDYTKA